MDSTTGLFRQQQLFTETVDTHLILSTTRSTMLTDHPTLRHALWATSKTKIKILPRISSDVIRLFFACLYIPDLDTMDGSRCVKKCQCTWKLKRRRKMWLDRILRFGGTEHKVSDTPVKRAWCVRLLYHCSGCGSSLEVRSLRHSPECWRSRVVLSQKTTKFQQTQLPNSTAQQL